MRLLDRAIGLLDPSAERGYRRRMREAGDLMGKGEMADARALYERLVGEAIQLYGADAELTLLTRGALANTYLDSEPERACRLLERIVQEGEGRFGPVDAGRLAPRLDLAAAYGQAGEYERCHELSAALLADCDRLLDPEDSATVKARYLVEHSRGDLARAHLAALLDDSRASFAEEPAPADWKERLMACASAIEAARSYRARMLWDTKPLSGASDGSLHLEYDFEFVRPDRFHLVRGAWRPDEADTGLPPGWGEFDEWIVLGDEHYSNPGMWWAVHDDDSKARYGRENHLLLADSYVDLLRDATPIAVDARHHERTAYLVAEYDAVAQAWSDLFEGSLSPREARTSLWIDLASGLLHVAEGGFDVPGDPEGVSESSAFKHGFSSYGEDIPIEPPQAYVEPD